MALRKITFASAWFTDSDGNHVAVHRGDVVDLPPAEVKRLEFMGAAIDPDEELDRPGQLLQLLDDASDEHVLSYLASGKVSEILLQAEGYPTPLVEKLLIAEKAGAEREKLITGLQERLGVEPGVHVPQIIPSNPGVPAVAASPAVPATQANADLGVTPVVTASVPAEPAAGEGDIVTADSTVSVILGYVEGHKDEADAFLAAENDKPEPRKSLVEGLNKIIAEG